MHCPDIQVGFNLGIKYFIYFFRGGGDFLIIYNYFTGKFRDFTLPRVSRTFVVVKKKSFLFLFIL